MFEAVKKFVQGTFKRPVRAGGKDSMPGAEGNTAGTSGGVIDVEAAMQKAVKAALAEQAQSFNGLVAEAIKPISESLKALQTAEKKEIDPNAPKPLTAEDVTKLAEQLLSEKLTQQKATAEQTALRDRFVKDLTDKKVPAEVINAHLPAAGDEAALTAASAKAVTRWNELAPKAADVGGAGKEGGAANAAGAGASTLQGLTPGQAAFAKAEKLPTAA